jgi:hypothetical protein
MTDIKLENQVFKIRHLVDEYRAGRIVIPEFQREYVWKKGRAPFLVDSLYRRFPISSLLVWTSSEPTIARRPNPRPANNGAVGWLIDAQQRVITLSRCMSGDEGIDVVFNPDAEEFRLANAATARDGNWYRLSHIWDDHQYRLIRRNLVGSQGEKRESAFDRVRDILDYEVPAVRMVDHAFIDAVDAFKRINTLGVKLKKEDIESAQVAARHSGFIANEVAPFLAEVRKQGFTRLTVMHLFRVCALVARPDGRNRTPLHELDKREVQAAWTVTKRAALDTIRIVRSELGLVNMDILWSGSLLVPLIAICATTGARERDTKGMIGWLSLAALFHRYSGASDTALDQDLRACKSDDAIGSLLKNVRRPGVGLKAVPKDFGGALVDRGGLLGLYIACYHRGAMDLFSSGKVILQSAVERHHILPRALFQEHKRSVADCIANIAFVTEGANRAVSSSGPDVYLAKLRGEVLESQCIPANRELWSIERATDFWEARRVLLADAFNDFLRSALPNRRF